MSNRTSGTGSTSNRTSEGRGRGIGRATATLARQTVAGLGVLVALTVVLGILYPAAVWAVSRIGTDSAEGSPLVDASGCVVGSALLGADPQVADGEPDRFFHARVPGSVADGDPFAPGDPAAGAPTNLGPNSDVLAGFVAARRAAIAERENVSPDAVPDDALTGPGSGLDPHISQEYAALQIPRVARATGRSVEDVTALVAEHTEGRQLGFLGEPRVNVGELNVALGFTAPDCTTPSDR